MLYIDIDSRLEGNIGVDLKEIEWGGVHWIDLA
jgi:hypothetical protein